MPDFIQTVPDAVEGPSRHNNRGLFSVVARRKGEVLCRLGGEVVAHGDDLAMLAATEWNALDDDLILRRQAQTNYYLINHSARPNLTIDSATHELRAKADIARGEELLLDYLENGFPQSYLRSERCAYLR